MDGDVVKYLSRLNQKIRKGCTAHISKSGRLYYMNHETKTSSWLPPVESWDAGGTNLPYGWEAAYDRDGKTYFINHVNRTTTCEDPRKDSDEEPPQPREVELMRDPQKGFGFVAGSEKPVIVRFVTEGGPSEGKLLPGDQILRINDEDVVKSPRERVIELVRSCKQSVKLQVCQPCTNNSTRKSALLTAAKKARLKSNPSRVRFAEGVVINGSPLYCPSPLDSCAPFLPNVLKVFLENGQTKSFKYDSTTTVQDVLNVLQEKLSISSLEHFSLVVEHIRSVRRNKLSILNPKDTLAKIAARPGAHNLRCLFRVTFVPKDIYEFMQRDPVAFDYLFVQCCNDVVQERFAPELKYDVALRLAALHLQQHAVASGIHGKVTVKTIEREYGLEKFVPVSLLDTMKRKELLKLLTQLMKQNQALSGPGQKQLSSIQAKFHYLKVVSELPSYGAKSFVNCTKNSSMEAAILIGPRIGISQISTIRNIAPLNLCQFGELESVEVVREDDFSFSVKLKLRHPEKECLHFTVEEKEIDEFVLVLERYYKQLIGSELPVEWEGRDPEPVEMVPTFHSKHTVEEAPWSYVPPSGSPPDIQQPMLPRLRSMDLSIPPPPYIPCEERQLSRSNSRDEFSLATSPSSVDHNMNEMRALVAALSSLPNFNKVKSHSESNLTKESSSDTLCATSETQDIMETTETTNCSKELAEQPDTIAARLQSQSDSLSGIDMHSVVSMELLETDNDSSRDDDVISRVTEMSKIVSDAELYLMRDDASMEPRDFPGGCCDSLLLVERNKSFLENPEHSILPSDSMPSESEAESTPTNSPTHGPTSLCESPKTIARKMCSSFGLHSPHLLASIDKQSEDVEELLRQLQASTDLPLEETTLCLDPDIIDLTIVPPPSSADVDFSQITPDGDSNPKSFLSFQDTGETEKEREESSLAFSPGYHPICSSSPGILFSNSPGYESYSAAYSSSQAPSSGYESCSLPPGEGSVDADEDDLAAYIIPPPPNSSSVVEEQNRVLARFRQAAEEVRRMMSQGHDGLACGKYAETINSVSKFCTMPRRHEEPHRPPLSSLASIVTPIREKTFASTLSSQSWSGNQDADAGHKKNVEEEMRASKVDETTVPPQRPPRVKRLNSGPLESAAKASDTPTSELPNGTKFVNGFDEVYRSSTDACFPKSFSMSSFKGSASRRHHTTSQGNGVDNGQLPGCDSVADARECHTTNGDGPCSAARVPNGHDFAPYVNGNGSGFQDLGLLDEPASLPDEVFKACHTCAGSKNGFACGSLGHFRSYHQSLPRNKIINSGLQIFPLEITNGTLENGFDNPCPGSGVFYEARQDIAEMVINLDSACRQRIKECAESKHPADATKLAKVRETLMTESRQFVTASKLFVKSITESSDKMEENLAACLALLDRIFAVSELVVMEMNKPCQINALVEKLKEMALAYSRTVAAAHCAASGVIPNPNMAGLMHQATSLATSLTTLMRTLRTFHTP